MTMSPEILATISATTLLFAVPIITFNLLGKRKKTKQLAKSFLMMANKSNHKVSQYEFWTNSAIGLDENSRKLLFLRRLENNENFQQIDLTEMKDCRVVIDRYPCQNSKKEKVNVKVGLAFSSHEKNKPDLILETYNSTCDKHMLTKELDVTEKWSDIVNRQIKTTI